MRLQVLSEMHIDRSKLRTLWYENEAGDIWEPDFSKDEGPPEAPKGYKYHHAQFPSTLHHSILRVKDDGSSEHVATIESGWPEDLVIALANSGDYELGEAILIAANACERCLNALAEQYGLDWGYPEGSEEWEKCGTTCEFCEKKTENMVEGEVRYITFDDLDAVLEQLSNYPPKKPVGDRCGNCGSVLTPGMKKAKYCDSCDSAILEAFDYDVIAKNKWTEILKDTMDKVKIRFDTENDEPLHKDERIITINKDPKDQFRCQIRAASGDWQQPSYYFRCQVVDGWAYDVNTDTDLSKYGKNMFCMIPPKNGGNEHLNTEKGKFFPPDDPYPKDPEAEPNEAKCWQWLKEQLAKMVKAHEKRIK